MQENRQIYRREVVDIRRQAKMNHTAEESYQKKLPAREKTGEESFSAGYVRHRHGGDIYSCDCRLDYSSNINPLGTPVGVVEAVYKSTEQIAHYPDVECAELRQALAEHEYLTPKQIICGNGAAELIFAYAAALHPKKALLISPGFAEYESALLASGCEIRYYPLSEERGFRVELDYLEYLSEDLDMLILCNPNNPTGVLIPQPLLVMIAGKCEKYGIHMLVDECFNQFLLAPDSYSMRTFLERFSCLFVLDAFTKTYAMPGLRLGYGMTNNAAVIEKMRQVMQPWSVSLPAQYAGIAALAEDTYVHNARWLVKEERKYLTRALRLLGMESFESAANYVFFKGPEDLAVLCRERGILIRDCSNYRGLEKGFFRIAVRTREENEQLVTALQDIVREKQKESGAVYGWQK